MMKLGFDGALMSGSGSCVFGITRNQEIMNKGYEFFRKRYFCKKIENFKQGRKSVIRFSFLKRCRNLQ